ncbi:hypothetical protein [Streptomyces kronopolitis]
MRDLVADALQVGATRRVPVLVGDALRKPDPEGGTGQVVIQVDPELVAMHPGPRSRQSSAISSTVRPTTRGCPEGGTEDGRGPHRRR